MSPTASPARRIGQETPRDSKSNDRRPDGWLYATHNADVFVYAGNSPRTAVIVRRDGSTDIGRIDAGTQWALRRIAWLTVELERPTETLTHTVDRFGEEAAA